jgi:hypothetical protein
MTTSAEEWDEIHGFVSPGEFARFLSWIEDVLADGLLREVAVEQRYAHATVFEERWFRATSGEIWRVVAPDPPFMGVFEKIQT